MESLASVNDHCRALFIVVLVLVIIIRIEGIFLMIVIESSTSVRFATPVTRRVRRLSSHKQERITYQLCQFNPPLHFFILVVVITFIILQLGLL